METMRVHTKKCLMCGKRGLIEHVPYEGWHQWKAGVPIQQALPELDTDEREQLISGTHPDCWDLLYPDAGDTDDVSAPSRDEAVHSSHNEDEGMDLEFVT